MSREIQSRVISIRTTSVFEEEIENIIWAESQPSGISNEENKRNIDVYYSPEKFPQAGFIRKLRQLPFVSSVKSRVIYKKDWNSRWQRTVKPVKISRNIVIVPPFKRYNKTLKGYKKIIINPAMAFGTGHHESTQGIMKLIYRHRKEIENKRVADFGSGSGILSIFAKMIGSGEVDAYDFDHECSRAIKENMSLNNTSGINFFNKSIRLCRRRYDVIFANMLFGEISSNREVIERSIKKDGLIFLSGILDCERENLLNIFRRFRLIDELLLNGWRSFLFVKL